ETRSVTRVRQRDDVYPHEIFSQPPYDGVLLSKAAVDGTSRGAGKYTLPQRHRLLRLGIREFFRLDHVAWDTPLLTMGDCGAFSYVNEEAPPYTVGEVIDFYECCGFDTGVSIDHVILGYQSEKIPSLPGFAESVGPWSRRQEITLSLAKDFLEEHKRRHARFTPVGVAQGWSPSSYVRSVKTLQKIGYDHLAIGGLVPLKTSEIVEVLAAIKSELRPGIQMHLFGVTRCEHIPTFADYGVTSFDSTSPLRQAFKDDKDNYYTPNGNYTAIRVPQVDGNMSLKRRIVAGVVRQQDARRLELECLSLLKEFDRGRVKIDDVLSSLAQYERIYDGKTDHSKVYRQMLQDQPWKACPCEICKELGIHVILFRGAERNRRRGFHNLFVFESRMRQFLDGNSQRNVKTRKGSRSTIGTNT
ncbi:MAG: tRNA-guanine transglycosylase DpdA, partial [Planctomycetota bacterium]|nr:tRNA-guanine transglycosylase DpdA [Planctomycetota bacterium]